MIIIFFRYVIDRTIKFFKEIIFAVFLQSTHSTCRFYDGVYVDKATKIAKNVVIFNNCIVINSEIGKHTFLQKNCRVTHARIGSFCSIAAGVVIGLGRHPLEYVSTHPAFYSNKQPLTRSFCKTDSIEVFKTTIIGHDVWIGENALIKDGVNIGIGSVIGAGAVVTKDVLPYSIVAGVPAKIIKYRFDELTRERLIKSNWWNLPDAVIEKLSCLFFEPDKFLVNIEEYHEKHKNRHC